MVKFTLSGLLVAAACINLMERHGLAKPKTLLPDVSLRGTIVQSQTVDDQGLDTRPAHNKFYGDFFGCAIEGMF